MFEWVDIYVIQNRNYEYYSPYRVELPDPTAANETRGSFARAWRCRGYITRGLTRVMTPIHQDVSAMTECE
jgi:hypothetical protein